MRNPVSKVRFFDALFTRMEMTDNTSNVSPISHPISLSAAEVSGDLVGAIL
jgi:hypothetical protein